MVTSQHGVILTFISEIINLRVIAYYLHVMGLQKEFSKHALAILTQTALPTVFLTVTYSITSYQGKYILLWAFYIYTL